MLTFYERVIVLYREEIRAFALGRFQEGPKNSLEDEIAAWDREGPPVDESPPWVGAAYLEKKISIHPRTSDDHSGSKGPGISCMMRKNFPEKNRTCSPDLPFALQSGTTAPGSNAFLQLRTVLPPAMGG